MGRLFYTLAQCTWGLPQTLVGLALFVLHRRDRHYRFHGAVVTEWMRPSSVSLGLFVFVAAHPVYHVRSGPRMHGADLRQRLVVHEYGHTIQSLVLGPFYLLVVGLPSAVWANARRLKQRRHVRQLSYYAFVTERTANKLGEWATGQPSTGQIVID